MSEWVREGRWRENRCHDARGVRGVNRWRKLNMYTLGPAGCCCYFPPSRGLGHLIKWCFVTQERERGAILSLSIPLETCFRNNSPADEDWMPPGRCRLNIDQTHSASRRARERLYRPFASAQWQMLRRLKGCVRVRLSGCQRILGELIRNLYVVKVAAPLLSSLRCCCLLWTTGGGRRTLRKF